MLCSLGQILFPLWASACLCQSLNGVVIRKIFKGLLRDTMSQAECWALLKCFGTGNT